MSPVTKPKFVIIGAGITGLVLAQAFKKEGVPFEIYERDPDAGFRGKGWGLTISWSLDQFFDLLPEDIISRLDETYVNPVAVKNGETGHFMFYDLQTGVARWQVPAARRIRVARERLRKLLMSGLDIQWNKTFVGAVDAGDQSITARFGDGSSTTGSQILGCDGFSSGVRQFLCPTSYQNHLLPFRMLGVSVTYSRAEAQAIRDLDPYFLQGGDPKTDTFFFFSFLDTPDNNSREDRDTYDCQLIISYPYRPGYLGSKEPIDVPANVEDRVALVKQITHGWIEPFRSIVQNIPSTAPAKSIGISEWYSKENAWDNRKGKITLLGDAAHTMPMFRAEAANNGIADASLFLSLFRPSWNASEASSFDSAKACAEYETVMIKRSSRAIRASTLAAEDAHNYAAINDMSALVNKRVWDD